MVSGLTPWSFNDCDVQCEVFALLHTMALPPRPLSHVSTAFTATPPSHPLLQHSSQRLLTRELSMAEVAFAESQFSRRAVGDGAQAGTMQRH